MFSGAPKSRISLVTWCRFCAPGRALEPSRLWTLTALPRSLFVRLTSRVPSVFTTSYLVGSFTSILPPISGLNLLRVSAEDSSVGILSVRVIPTCCTFWLKNSSLIFVGFRSSAGDARKKLKSSQRVPHTFASMIRMGTDWRFGRIHLECSPTGSISRTRARLACEDRRCARYRNFCDCLWHSRGNCERESVSSFESHKATWG